MPHIHRHILRLDQRRHHLQHIEMLGQLHQLLKTLPGARTAPAFQVGGERRT
jgi:signal recognition particle GTPase